MHEKTATLQMQNVHTFYMAREFKFAWILADVNYKPIFPIIILQIRAKIVDFGARI